MGGGGEVCSTRRPALGHVLARTRLGRSTRVTRCASGGERDAPAPPPPPSAKDAVLARIRKAQQYKSERMSSKPQAPLDSTDAAGQGGRRPEQQPQQVAASTSSPSAGSTAGDTLPVSAPLQQQWQQQQRQRPGTASSPDALAAEQRSFRTQEGDANDAASWLKTAAVSTQGTAQQIDMNLSAEQFMLAKEELIRQQEVEIITVDAAYAARVRREKEAQRQQPGGADASAGPGAAGAGTGEEYRPKVSTWGVFPRAKNISQAYGGGRTLRPGQPLESEEAATRREQRVSTALSRYRQAAGLELDAQDLEAAQRLMDAGRALFADGLISQALPKFEEAAELLPLRTALGGEARLQQAICLDSLGRNQEAYQLYVQLEQHTRGPGVAKQAKRMLYGFRAAKDLKVEQMSYAPTTVQWRSYFDRVLENSSALYVSSEDSEDDGGAALAAAAATAVMVLPLVFVVWKVLQ